MKITSTAARVIVFLLLATVCVGCNEIASSPTATLPALPTVQVDQISFQDAETKQHFVSLDQCINKIIDAKWTAIPYHLSGNFYQASWCRGTGAAPDCRLAGSTIENKDQQVFNLNTLTYPQEPPAYFGLGLDVLWVPAESGWGAHFSFSEKGGSVMGEHWGVSFFKFKPQTDQIESNALLWSYDQYQVGDIWVEYSFGLPLRDDLARYLKSPEAMRDRRLEQLRALAQKVKTTIETHQATICDYGPDQKNGIPPVCTPRPLTSAEEAEELVKAEKYYSAQEQIMSENYQALYTAWMKAFPMDQCWPK